MNPKNAARETPSPSSVKRRLLIAVIVIVCLLVLGAILLPILLNPERHRNRIEAVLEEQTGWQAELGEINLSLLEGLVLRVSPVSLSAGEDGSSLSIETLVVRAPILPLLRGRLQVKSITLRKPQVRLVRRSVEEGWILPATSNSQGEADNPAPGTEAPVPAAASTGEKANPVRIEIVSIEDGAILVDDRSGASPLVVGLEDLDLELHPNDLSFSGTAAIAGELGHLSLAGRAGETITIELEDVKTELLEGLVGPDLVHAGGLISGQVEAAGGGRFGGDLTIRDLRLLDGTTPLSDSSLHFRIEGEGEAWQLAELHIDLAEIPVEGHGTLTPDLALKLNVAQASIESLLKVTNATIPLPLEVEGPGRLAATLEIEMPQGKELSYAANGTLSAARLKAADLLPDARDLETRFTLDRAGRLELVIDDGTMAGGPLRGTLRIEQLIPPGEMSFEGALNQAHLSGLLTPLLGEKGSSLGGLAEVETRVTLELADEDITPSSLGGELQFHAGQLALAGWDLEGAIRAKLEEKLKGLNALGKLALGKSLTGESAQDTKSTKLLDTFDAKIDLGQIPWSLKQIHLRGGQIAATGEGHFDPSLGVVDLKVSAALDREKSAEWLARYPALKYLSQSGGKLTFPLKITGPMTGPSINVDLGSIAKRDETKDAVKGLLNQLLKKKKH